MKSDLSFLAAGIAVVAGPAGPAGVLAILLWRTVR